ncbi:unnamed protein product [Owenia fusiformis]|uniref:WASH complex subunit 3 n=1 Tax=Owenia fusiformis TaxID=6347 RepID=A0A8J1TA14_OWEFU|nr:unnamed protein product [Owenia fusiformis]
MDEDGLPIVGTGIDLSKVGAINQKRTLAFLNHFITHTVRFLNRFSCVCEDKLEHLTVRIQRLETTMSVLEAKLSSIPGLENVTLANSGSSTQSAATPAAPAASATPAGEGPVAPPAAQAEETSTAPAAPEEPEQSSTPVSKDPRYQKYFKMVNMGVHEQAVKMKMKTEGVDPDLLDDPNAPAPPADDNSDSDFSNNDSDSDDDFSD